MSLDASLRNRIQGIVDSSKVVLFMKGDQNQPRCGFSAGAIGILQEVGVEFRTVDILQDAELRQGIKVFSDWPTIPQLYVGGEFIGGSDIMRQMAGNGELHEALGLPYTPPQPPTFHVSEACAAAFRELAAGQEGVIRIGLGDGWRYRIGLDRPRPGDFLVEAAGLTIHVGRSEAKKLDGLRLDYAPGEDGGLSIENPNEPPRVTQRSPSEVSALLRDNPGIRLYDVRSPRERMLAKIEGAVLLDERTVGQIRELPKDTPLVFYCHHGVRSLQAAEFFRGEGFTNLTNMTGGIDAWSQEVDAAVPRY